MSELIDLLSKLDYFQILGGLFIIRTFSDLFRLVGFGLFSSLILSLFCCLLCVIGALFYLAYDWQRYHRRQA